MNKRNLLDIILQEYQLNETEERLLPYFRKISGLFQYPNVCALVYWMKFEERRDKVVCLIREMIKDWKIEKRLFCITTVLCIIALSGIIFLTSLITNHRLMR